MFDFNSDVGIEFTEAASGHVATRISDPQTAERLGRSRGASLRFSIQVSAPRLQDFLTSPVHVAEISGGTVSWKPKGDAAVLPGGRVTFFRRADSLPSHKFIDFDFSFAASGRTYRLSGSKELQDDNGLDASTDLSTIRLTIHADGHFEASGVVRSNLVDLVRQLQSCKVVGARVDDEADAAKAAFLGFFNAEIREVYPEIPVLFDFATQFTPEQRRTLELFARVLLPSNLPPNGPQIADVTEALDRFLANASASLLATIRTWLQVIGIFVPAGAADPKLLRLLITAQLNDTARSPIRDVLQLLHTLVVFPYYSHPKADALVSYTRPVHQPRNTPDLPVAAEPPDRVFDFVIAGSGPAGALLAQRLSATGKSVLLLEAGPYIPERTIDADELVATARLYKSSGLQQANTAPLAGLEGPAFTVLQGACLGGGGVINNAVCFRLPARRLAHWQSLGFPVSEPDLAAAYTRVADELGIKPSSEAVAPSGRLNPTHEFLAKKLGPVRKPPVADPPSPGLYECLVNLEDCLGTGLCNVGCGSERKRNGVQVYLRQAAAAGCVIVDRAEVQGLRVDRASPADGRRIESVDVRLRGGRHVSVKGRQFILACGPIASSVALLRSGDLKEHLDRNQIPVGRRFSANLGSPIFAFCRQPVNQRPGLQIAHYYVPPPPDEGFVIETWFNPPGANSIAIPGFQQAHFDRMMAYSRTVAASPLVGSEAVGSVSLDWQGAPLVNFPISSADLRGLRRGLVILAGAFLAGDVESAIVGLGNGRTLQTEADLSQLDTDLQEIEQDPAKSYLLKIGTGHPQGGNAMSLDPRIGVLDAEFRLRGFSNLRVCDGSIFPESAGVNPQWTIMALAHECARKLTAS